MKNLLLAMALAALSLTAVLVTLAVTKDDTKDDTKGEKIDGGGNIPVVAGADGEDEDEDEVEREEVFFVASGSASWKPDEKKWTVRSYLNKKSLRIDDAVDQAMQGPQ